MAMLGNYQTSGGPGGHSSRGGHGDQAGHRVFKQESSPKRCIWHPQSNSHDTSECRAPGASHFHGPEAGPSSISQTTFGGRRTRFDVPPPNDYQASPPRQVRGRGGLGAAMDEFHVRSREASPGSQASGHQRPYDVQPASDGFAVRGRANVDHTFRGRTPSFGPPSRAPAGPRRTDACQFCGRIGHLSSQCWHKPAERFAEREDDLNRRIAFRARDLMSSQSLNYDRARMMAEAELQPRDFRVRDSSESPSEGSHNSLSLEQRMTGGPYGHQISSSQSRSAQQIWAAPPDLHRKRPQHAQPTQQGFAGPDVQMGEGSSGPRDVVSLPSQNYGDLQQDLLICRAQIQCLQHKVADNQPSISLPSPVDPFPMDTIERWVQTLQHAYCAICLCATPSALGSVNPGSAKHTELTCQFYLTGGVPDSLETRFWARYCPLFQGKLPYCDTCDTLGYIVDREHDTLVAGAARAPDDRMRLFDEAAGAKKGEWCAGKGGLNAVIWCDCQGAARELGKSWRSYEAVNAARKGKRGLKGKARANPAHDGADPSNPSLQCQTPGGRVWSIRDDAEL